MNDISVRKPPQLTPVSLKKNSVRLILGATVVAIIVSQLSERFFSTRDQLVLVVTVLYFAGTGIWLRIAKSRSFTKSFYHQISTADALIISVSTAYFFHNVFVSLILLALILFNATIIASLRQTVTDLGAFLLGAGIASMIQPFQWAFTATTPTLSLLALGIVGYLVMFAYYIQRRFHRLKLENKKHYNDLVLQKVRSYKLSRYVTPTVWNALNQGKDASLKADRKRITVFFSDIAGFSSLSEELEAEVLNELLNNYLTEMVKIATKHRGTIDKFMGDGLMVLFGDTQSGGMKADCMRCIAMALDMRRKMKELENKWYNQGIKKRLKIRMGINSGYCTVGTFGTSEYMDYTVLGTHVNLASRLESAAEPGEILVSHETWSLIKESIMCRDRGEIKAKGFSHPIKVYQVINLRKELGSNQSYFEEYIQGFSMHVDLEKVKNYDRDRIAEQLQNIANKLRDK